MPVFAVKSNNNDGHDASSGYSPNKLLIDNDVHLIAPSLHPRAVAAEISKCEHVISSSLHGIIFADAYGVPSTWLHDEMLPSNNQGVFKVNVCVCVFGVCLLFVFV